MASNLNFRSYAFFLLGVGPESESLDIAINTNEVKKQVLTVQKAKKKVCERKKQSFKDRRHKFFFILRGAPQLEGALLFFDRFFRVHHN